MLKLEAELPKRAKLSFWPFLDLCAIGLFFVLFSSKFVMAPGITLALPEVGSSQVAISPLYEVVTVTEVKGEEMIFFKDSKFNLDSLEKLFAKRGKAPQGATLLVKADVAVSMRTLALLSELAIESGYSRVQLATEERQAVGGTFGGGR
ncbi:biopolymer transporter ExbD [Pelagicoccus sp. SDUM812002]|uniref:ExbD/TolR family protein n=1 Tax=Pelagicoccus sp. SDUM812002 TaxID=3041266 RepID=UPI00280D53ED|nr:biopolymer transporter ExbD [Pelagicoccus sp. SDUM812002]MDQ8187255.1 biopolymer transporter ExbD [Pelagicoccus sp. SDUM812002]